ncbi:RING_finger and CHY zinc finger domain-containing protein [Hexamita inflata]|uniref:RING_finger and CHY zinc finger domain-containing protein n=1 Tax=Hexamita inflata TaxID=28002 RepID=A0ABP1JRU4_9EUKA
MKTNEVVCTTLFRLKEETEDIENSENHIFVREFVSDVVADETRQALTNQTVYALMPLENFDLNKTYFVNVYEFGEKTIENYKNVDLLFAKTKIVPSVGCEHYVRRCQLKCEICQKYYTCRFCHNEVEDHEFPRFQTKIVRCMKCQTEQDISIKCTHCDNKFGLQYCDLCKLITGISDEAKPLYHCDQCKLCNVGIKELNQHCDQCDSCYLVPYFDTHVCKKQGTCIVCLGDLHHSIYGSFIMKCGHEIHLHCYENLVEMDNYKCPVCKKFILTVVSEPTLILTNVYVIIALENQITVFMLIITYSINSAVHFFFTSSFR